MQNRVSYSAKSLAVQIVRFYYYFCSCFEVKFKNGDSLSYKDRKV
jgi:hypothetical protein